MRLERNLSTLLFAIVLMMAGISVIHADYTTNKLTNNRYHDHDPRISDNGTVVWLGNVYDDNTKGWEIFVKEGKKAEQLTTNDYSERGLQINANGQMIWAYRTDNNPTIQDIYFYDGTDTVILAEGDWDNYNPQINDDGQAVWYGYHYDGLGAEIFFYDGTSVLRLTNDADWDRNPQINNNGQIVWHTTPANGSDTEIYMYDAATQTTTQLTDNNTSGSDPRINDGGQVVWNGYDGNDWEIYFYDGTTTINLSNNNDFDSLAEINNSGQVVWAGYVGTAIYREIFFYDGINIIRLTDNNVSDLYPQINDSGVVTWAGRANGNYDVYVYDGTTIEQLSSLGIDTSWPQINNAGQVVWDSWDAHGDGEIFLATPDTNVPPPSGIDLTISDLIGPARVYPGDQVRIDTYLTNQGTEPAPGRTVEDGCAYTVKHYISTDTTITTNDIQLSSYCPNALDAGATFRFYADVIIPPDFPAGFYYWGAIADDADAVSETDETNNTLAGNRVKVMK